MAIGWDLKHFLSVMATHQYGNPDHRRAVTVAAPSNEEIEARLRDLLTPGTFASLKTVKGSAKQLRDRVLTLPVMAAIVLSLVYRQVSGLSEVLRLLEQEGLMWAGAITVSKQALSNRLRDIPAQLFAQMFEQVVARSSQQVARLVPSEWEQVESKFAAVWLADGSTLEALVKKLPLLKDQKSPLGGRMMMMVDAWSLRPTAAWYTEDQHANDKTWCEVLLAKLPVNGLLVFDMGFFSFVWFDAFTDAGKWFVTRLRQKTADKVVRVLSQGHYYRDEIIEMGQYRSNPCVHPVRLVSVRWSNTWYTYITNVLDPGTLSPQQVCDLYRRRWRIEDAFLLTKRLLGLAYLWVAGTNGVQIQIYATWIFYLVLIDLCSEVAVALRQPLERISVEMVFRSLYHFSRARQFGRATDIVPFLVDNARSFGLVKAQRKRHRYIKSQSLDIWASFLS
jgi:Transposase DDE domain